MKNIVIGFLMGLCTFLMIGAIETPAILNTPPEQLIKQLIGLERSRIGKYQGFSANNNKYMLNTENGALYKAKNVDNTWERISIKTDWIKE